MQYAIVKAILLAISAAFALLIYNQYKFLVDVAPVNASLSYRLGARLGNRLLNKVWTIFFNQACVFLLVAEDFLMS